MQVLLFLVCLSLLPTNIFASKVRQIISARTQTFAVLEDHSLWGWGSKDEGLLFNLPSDPVLKPHRIEGNKKVVSLAEGGPQARFRCAILELGQVVCWGHDTQGELGLGLGFATTIIGDNSNETFDQLIPVALGSDFQVKKLVQGTVHTCALSKAGTVKCWGGNWSSQLGLGDFRPRGTQKTDMGDNLPLVKLGASPVVDICAGELHNCVLQQSGKVKCWGDSRGAATGNHLTTGGKFSDMGGALKAISFPKGVTANAIACGAFSTCVVLSSGNIKCWGLNKRSILGTGKRVDYWAGEKGIVELEGIDAVSLGTVSAKRIYCGESSCCAVFENRAMKCWGDNSGGQLGIGDRLDRGDEKDALSDMGKNLPFVNLGPLATIKQVSISGSSSCAVMDSGLAKCWGKNTHGQLGQGHKNVIGGVPNQMGENLPALEFK